ncbi:hypothetical protein [Stutzerimonas xanthomarina]|uniref:hypothetical protein n=1 Tax=Stutzerimonas xanthomarina TaxID=271420 RepID=UPI003AA907BA
MGVTRLRKGSGNSAAPHDQPSIRGCIFVIGTPAASYAFGAVTVSHVIGRRIEDRHATMVFIRKYWVRRRFSWMWRNGNRARLAIVDR